MLCIFPLCPLNLPTVQFLISAVFFQKAAPCIDLLLSFLLSDNSPYLYMAEQKFTCNLHVKIKKRAPEILKKFASRPNKIRTDFNGRDTAYRN